jgi:hypothetical protein
MKAIPDEFLNSDTIKNNLMISALYLTAYELLRSAIIDNIKQFFLFGGEVPDEQYKNEVTRVHKDLLHASCLWLQGNNVITEEDLRKIENIRRHRNQIAHELPKLLLDGDNNLSLGYLLQIRELLEKIELWWVINVEIPANQNFDGDEISEKDIHPGRVILMDYIVSSASTEF